MAPLKPRLKNLRRKASTFFKANQTPNKHKNKAERSRLEELFLAVAASESHGKHSWLLSLSCAPWTVLSEEGESGSAVQSHMASYLKIIIIKSSLWKGDLKIVILEFTTNETSNDI